jgi:hypothetical protein
MIEAVHRTTFGVSSLRLVFGPAPSVPALLRALAEAIEPVDVVPSEVVCTRAADGYRLRVTCSLATDRPDLAAVLAHLVRARRRTDAGQYTPAAPPAAA